MAIIPALLAFLPIIIGGIWVFIDWIMILVGAFKDKLPLKKWSMND